jgi:hypothetical protein
MQFAAVDHGFETGSLMAEYWMMIEAIRASSSGGIVGVIALAVIIGLFRCILRLIDRSPDIIRARTAHRVAIGKLEAARPPKRTSD